ncbi:hypothetical protein BaRGS_00022609 [Batillaria attramentaria]|uniref:Arginine-glutamic acid dipeptide repeats protein n=1 Tax=Batillaria attramentaria TaxID=370345 RepID=A0ABD0KFX5_9CAEN
MAACNPQDITNIGDGAVLLRQAIGAEGIPLAGCHDSILSFTPLLLSEEVFVMTSEVPGSSRQKKGKAKRSRSIEKLSSGESIIKDAAVRSRELFTSDASDTVPITALRGKCQVVHYQDIRSARAFKPAPDVFFYVLGYNPQTKRLATTQGEIRVGSSHQARLPECKPNLQPADMPEKCDNHEEIKWRPLHVMDGDLMMYLRAARSIAAFAGMCDGGSADDGCQAASMDETTMNAMDILHRNSYDTGKALQALVKSPAMKTIEKKWNEEDSKRFVKGLRQYGKNFFKIRKELLPHRETGELIEYYYFWKKTPSAVSNRPHRRHRRQGGLKRQNTRSASQPSEYLDQSSASECSDDSDDSDGGRDLSTYVCRHCFTTTSKDWHHAGKERTLLCTKCRLFFKKYGEDRPVDGEKEPPPFLFKPVKEEEDLINGKHNMRTRRSNPSGENKGKKSERQSTSSPDIEGPANKTGRKSPSAASTGSCSSNDKDSAKDRLGQNKPDSKNRKRQRASDSEGKTKKKKDQDRSDSESMLDSSEDDLSASSQPSTPSSLDTEFKSAKDYIKPEPITQSPLVAAGVGSAGLVDSKPPIGLSYPHPHPFVGTFPSVAARHAFEPPHTASTSTEVLSVPSLSTQTSSAVSAQSVLSSSSSSSLAPSTAIGSASTMTSMSSTGVTLMSSGSGASGEGEREKKYVPPQLQPSQQQPVPGIAGAMFSPYHPHPYFPYASHMGPRIAGPPPPPVPSLVPIKKEPGSPTRGEPGSGGGSRDGPDESHAKLQPSHMPVPPPLTSIDSAMPGSLVDRTGLAGMDALRDNSREAILPLTGNIPHHIALGAPLMPGEKSRADGQNSSLDGGRLDGGLGPSSALRPGGKPEDIPIVEEVEDSDSDREGSTSPGPNPTPCSKEVYKSQSALFIKVLDRGERNCCSRCDLIFKPQPNSALARRREERKRPDTPPKSASVDSQGPSGSSSTPHHGPFPERHTPRPFADTPALRQLHEYARPHVLGQDPQRGMPYGLPGLGGPPPPIDHLANYHRLAMYPPGSRERLELELERDKRERDARERELRERELREMEMREKMKAEMDLKPPGMPASKPGLERLLPPGTNPLDPHWLELQRRFGYPPAAGGLVLPPGAPGGAATAAGAGGGHVPGVYPPVSLANELVAREREKLERLGLPTGPHPTLPADLSYASAVERLSAERQHAERLGLIPPSNPNEALARLQMQQENNQLAAAAALREGGGGGGPLPAIHPLAHLYPPVGPPDVQQLEAMSTRFIYQYYSQRLTSDQLVYMQRVTNEFYLRTKQEKGLVDPSQLIYQFSRADPLSGLQSSSATPSSLSSLHPSAQPLLHGATSREQELLQRELYSRAYMDPALAHQLSAQAHHEAIQRQLALERERFGATGHLPH